MCCRYKDGTTAVPHIDDTASTRKLSPTQTGNLFWCRSSSSFYECGERCASSSMHISSLMRRATPWHGSFHSKCVWYRGNLIIFAACVTASDVTFSEHIIFSPCGMHAPRAICFDCVDFFLKINFLPRELRIWTDFYQIFTV